MGKISGFHFALIVVVRIINQSIDCLLALSTNSAVGVDVARLNLNSGVVVSRFAANCNNLRQSHYLNAAIGTQSAKIDLEAATWTAQFRKIPVQLSDSPAERWIFLDKNNVHAVFGDFECGGQSADSTADY